MLVTFFQLACLLAPSVTLASAAAHAALSFWTTPLLRSTNSTSPQLALDQTLSILSSTNRSFPPLAAISAGLWTYLYLVERRPEALVGSLSAVFSLPFTLFVIDQYASSPLVDLANSAREEGILGVEKHLRDEVDRLLRRFEALNGLRSLVLALGGLVGLWSLL